MGGVYSAVVPQGAVESFAAGRLSVGRDESCSSVALYIVASLFGGGFIDETIRHIHCIENWSLFKDVAVVLRQRQVYLKTGGHRRLAKRHQAS